MFQLTPAQSKSYNQPCEILNFFDKHDIWHFLSAASMFFSFMVSMMSVAHVLYICRDTWNVSIVSAVRYILISNSKRPMSLSQASPLEICGRSGTETAFFRVHWFSIVVQSTIASVSHPCDMQQSSHGTLALAGDLSLTWLKKNSVSCRRMSMACNYSFILGSKIIGAICSRFWRCNEHWLRHSRPIYSYFSAPMVKGLTVFYFNTLLMLPSFPQVLLTLDDDLIFVHRSQIPVFWILSVDWSSWCSTSVITKLYIEW
jgi:hypothetical protein